MATQTFTSGNWFNVNLMSVLSLSYLSAVLHIFRKKMENCLQAWVYLDTLFSDNHIELYGIYTLVSRIF